MISSLQRIAIVLVLFLFLQGTATAQVIYRLSEVLAGLKNHPEVLMLQASERTWENRIPMRSSLMDPMLILGVQNLPTSFSFTEEPMTTKLIGLSQGLKFPGKLSAERTLGELDVRIATLETEIKLNDLRYAARLGYAKYVKAISARSRSAETVSRLRELVSTVIPRIETGQASLIDALRIEVEIGKMQAMGIEEEGMRKMVLLELSSLSRMEHLDSIVVEHDWTVSSNVEELVDLTYQRNPLLRTFALKSTKLQEQRGRASLERYPDGDIMLMYMHRSDLKSPDPMTGGVSTQQTDMIGLQLSVNLPLNYGGKIDAAIAEIDGMEEMSRFEEAAMRLEMSSMLREAMLRMETAKSRLLLIENTLASRLSLSADLGAARLGIKQNELASLITTEIDRIDYLRMRDESRVTMIEAMATIMYLTNTF